MADAPALFDLTGRVAVVTGASSGLGRHAADVLVGAGAKVVGVARRADALAEWSDGVGAAGAVVAADLAQTDALAQLAKDVAQPFGDPDIVVHAAGINTREVAENVTPEGWNTTLSLNLSAPFFLTQHLVPS